uniref:Uncharacterized protein n=1 Tax=Gasterosteus aculeatus aculeatus TaxID=481459 RepID=A0AAQ4RSY4_GASAC
MWDNARAGILSERVCVCVWTCVFLFVVHNPLLVGGSVWECKRAFVCLPWSCETCVRVRACASRTVHSNYISECVGARWTLLPVATQPVATQPVAKQPVAKQPVATQPVAKQPVAKQPVATQPVAKQPVATQPVAKQPVAKQPVAKQPVAKQPVATQPVATQPVATQPVATQPVAKQCGKVFSECFHTE